MATKKTNTKKKTRRTKAKPCTRGLEATEVVGDDIPEAVTAIATGIESDGGAVVAKYRDPLGGHWQLIASLPLDKVAPIAFQRDLSDTHVKKLHGVIDRIDRFLDPIITVRAGEGQYHTPNGHHRLEAMKRIGARSILSIVVVEPELAYQILALNTEKAPNLKDRSLECIRMVRSLVDLGDEPESTYAIELEEPSYLTIGAAYEKKARFSGSAYQSILKKVETFLDDPLSETIPLRESRAARVLEVDEEVAQIVKELKEAGFSSPYLKTFVVARINPVRGPKAKAEFDEAIDKMLEKAQNFDVNKVEASQISASGGYGGGD